MSLDWVLLLIRPFQRTQTDLAADDVSAKMLATDRVVLAPDLSAVTDLFRERAHLVVLYPGYGYHRTVPALPRRAAAVTGGLVLPFCPESVAYVTRSTPLQPLDDPWASAFIQYGVAVGGLNPIRELGIVGQYRQPVMKGHYFYPGMDNDAPPSRSGTVFNSYGVQYDRVVRLFHRFPLYEGLFVPVTSGISIPRILHHFHHHPIDAWPGWEYVHHPVGTGWPTILETIKQHGGLAIVGPVTLISLAHQVDQDPCGRRAGRTSVLSTVTASPRSADSSTEAMMSSVW